MKIGVEVDNLGRRTVEVDEIFRATLTLAPWTNQAVWFPNIENPGIVSVIGHVKAEFNGDHVLLKNESDEEQEVAVLAGE